MGSSSPIFGVKIKNKTNPSQKYELNWIISLGMNKKIFELPPPRYSANVVTPSRPIHATSLKETSVENPGLESERWATVLPGCKGKKKKQRKFHIQLGEVAKFLDLTYIKRILAGDSIASHHHLGVTNQQFAYPLKPGSCFLTCDSCIIETCLFPDFGWTSSTNGMLFYPHFTSTPWHPLCIYIYTYNKNCGKHIVTSRKKNMLQTASSLQHSSSSLLQPNLENLFFDITLHKEKHAREAPNQPFGSSQCTHYINPPPPKMNACRPLKIRDFQRLLAVSWEVYLIMSDPICSISKA